MQIEVESTHNLLHYFVLIFTKTNISQAPEKYTIKQNFRVEHDGQEKLLINAWSWTSHEWDASFEFALRCTRCIHCIASCTAKMPQDWLSLLLLSLSMLHQPNINYSPEDHFVLWESQEEQQCHLQGLGNLTCRVLCFQHLLYWEIVENRQHEVLENVLVVLILLSFMLRFKVHFRTKHTLGHA